MRDFLPPPFITQTHFFLRTLSALTAPASSAQNPVSAGALAPGVAQSGSAELQPSPAANFGPKEKLATHE